MAEREPSEWALRAAVARHRFEEEAPSSADLTAQQWYNVCKFFPTVAQRASAYSHRPLAQVGPDNPLDAIASPGPFASVLRRRLPRRDPEAEQMREVIRDETDW